MRAISVGTQWPPGVSGNPRGRKISAAIDARLEREGEAEGLVDSMFDKVRNEGDVSAFKEITLRHEGHVAHEVGGNITVIHKVIHYEDSDAAGA